MGSVLPLLNAAQGFRGLLLESSGAQNPRDSKQRMPARLKVNETCGGPDNL